MRSKYFAITLLFCLSLVSCDKGDIPYIMESGTRFHTTYHITYQSDKPLTLEFDTVFTTFNDVLNPFDVNSLVAKFNRNESKKLHPMLKEVISKAQEVSKITGGAYDITGAPYFDIWGFGTRKGVTRTATEMEIDSISYFVGYDKVLIYADSISKTDPRVTLNPSSLSKGYIVDLIALLLEEKGVENYLVEIGGEVVAKGLNPKGQCWKVGINKPVEDNTSTNNDLLYAISLCDGEGMASSGDYRNFKEIDGKKVAHTIDVRTGYPAHQDILSATVLAPTCMEADAWATAFMTLGLEESKKLLEEQLSHLKVCFIYEEGGEFVTYQRGLELSKINE